MHHFSSLFPAILHSRETNESKQMKDFVCVGLSVSNVPNLMPKCRPGLCQAVALQCEQVCEIEHRTCPSDFCKASGNMCKTRSGKSGRIKVLEPSTVLACQHTIGRQEKLEQSL